MKDVWTPVSFRARPREIELSVPALPAGLDGLRILHIADMHSRRYGRDERCVREALGGEYDLAVVTGDLCYPPRIRLFAVDLRPVRAAFLDPPANTRLDPKVKTGLEVADKLFAGLDRPVVAVQGNHDPDLVMEHLAGLGVTVLANNACQVSVRGGEAVQVVGVRCANRRHTDVAGALARVRGDGFTIALCHYPEYGPALAQGGAGLVLSGHTHGGQYCLPGGRALLTHSRTGRHFLAGAHRLGQSTLFVSRGVGASLLPFRTFCPAEVPLLVLRHG